MSRRKFSFNNIAQIPEDLRGIYCFWTHNRCIYVGKADKLPIRKRLMSHYKKSHNDDLNLWLNSSIVIEYTYLVVEPADSKVIDETERIFIKKFRPVTNKTLNI